MRPCRYNSRLGSTIIIFKAVKITWRNYCLRVGCIIVISFVPQIVASKLIPGTTFFGKRARLSVAPWRNGGHDP